MTGKLLLRGKLWRLVRKHRIPEDDGAQGQRLTTIGLCDHGTKTITVRRRLGKSTTLAIALHEWLHVEFPEMGHRRINRMAKQGASLLMALGVRVEEPAE